MQKLKNQNAGHKMIADLVLRFTCF